MELIISTSTAACSVALFNAGKLERERHEIVGRGHAEKLIPMIADLMAGGRANRIFVDLGPGSFTGVRVGIAAARALAIAWGAELQGFSSLSLIAASVSTDEPLFGVVMPGGHGDYFVQRFSTLPLSERDAAQSLSPAALAPLLQDIPCFGPAAPLFGGADEDANRLPRSADFTLLPQALARLEPKPLYIRAPDAVAR